MPSTISRVTANYNLKEALDRFNDLVIDLEAAESLKRTMDAALKDQNDKIDNLSEQLRDAHVRLLRIVTLRGAAQVADNLLPVRRIRTIAQTEIAQELVREEAEGYAGVQGIYAGLERRDEATISVDMEQVLRAYPPSYPLRPEGTGMDPNSGQSPITREVVNRAVERVRGAMTPRDPIEAAMEEIGIMAGGDREDYPEPVMQGGESSTNSVAPRDTFNGDEAGPAQAPDEEPGPGWA